MRPDEHSWCRRAFVLHAAVHTLAADLPRTAVASEGGTKVAKVIRQMSGSRSATPWRLPPDWLTDFDDCNIA
jgi:hypothetical protein